MKIIDLLNLIAKGEEVPKMVTANKIEDCEDMIFIYDKNIQDYKTKDEDYLFQIAFNKSFPVLNKEVEIIEEEKEIKKFHYNNAIWEEQARDLDYMFKDKIDELIDEINKLKRDKE